MQRRARRLDLVDDVRIGQARGLLEVANEAVHGPGVNNVKQTEPRRHEDLRCQNQQAGDVAGLEHLHADEQVHAFVLSFLQQGVDPTMVALQQAQRAEVAEHRRHEARHAGKALEHDEPPLDRPDRGILRLVPGDPVEALVQGVHGAVRALVAEGLRLVLAQVQQALLDLMLLPNVVLHQVHDGLLAHRELRGVDALPRLGLQRGGEPGLSGPCTPRPVLPLLAAASPPTARLLHGRQHQSTQRAGRHGAAAPQGRWGGADGPGGTAQGGLEHRRGGHCRGSGWHEPHLVCKGRTA
mmetsp:Transcript_67255/g.194703  ORF Transcript_67255/g.194703 Transcript_67255/m.194703 type:complete len:296 (-) Transcript_67255:21-908(-)